MTAHVVAAVLADGCDVVVTYNVRNFPAEALSPLGLRALQPDDFLMEVAAADPDGAVAAVRSMVAAKKYPPRTMEEELEGLRINMLDRSPTSSSGRLGRADGSSASWVSVAAPSPSCCLTSSRIARSVKAISAVSGRTLRQAGVGRGGVGPMCEAQLTLQEGPPVGWGGDLPKRCSGETRFEVWRIEARTEQARVSD